MPDSATTGVDPTAAVIRGRYRIDRNIGHGAVGTVYRAVDLLTSRFVAVKRVRTASGAAPDEDSTFERTTIANEFRMLSGLRHPNVVSVLDYGFDEDGWPIVVMELVPGAKNLLDASESSSQPERVDLIVQLLRAVEYLRRHGVIHRDIKPSNVLVQNGKVKLVDFGISLDTAGRSGFDGVLRGTYAYLAPELFLGAPLTASADVYSVGVVAYEVFARRHPHGSAANLIAALRPGAPRPAPCAASPIGSAVERMMAYLPEERPTPELASQLLLGAQRASARPPANVVSSYLRAARFVGRREELRILDESLMAVDRGVASSWLLHGASGAGKSRLMAELRTIALVAGFEVVEAQCAQETRAPYAPWRTLFRQMELFVPELQQGNANAWLTAQAPASVAVEWQDEGVRDGIRKRMLAAAKGLIGSLARKTLILVDDIQWLDEESLWLLEQILPLSNVPAAFCVACRTEESRGIHLRLARCRQVTVHHLGAADVAELAESMLGAPAQKPLVSHLVRETDGNPFFIVETMHTLAEHMDTLATLVNVEPSLIPATLRGVLAKRLGAVDDATRTVLDVAAVHGRTIDPALLISLFSTAAVEDALHAAADVAIIEPTGDAWRFCHDQMRAAFLDGLDAAKKRRMHLDLAHAVLALSGGSLGTAAVLARHFRGADDSIQERKYALAAGREAFGLGAYDQAVECFSRVLEVGAFTEFEQAQARRELAEALIGMGRMEEAQTHLTRGVSLLVGRRSANEGGRSRGTKQHAYELSRIHERLAHTRYFDNDVFGVFDASVRAYWYAQHARAKAELARASANLAGCFELGVTNPLARALRSSAHRLVTEAGDPGAEGWVLQIDGVAAAGRGRLPEAEECLRRAEAVWTRTGNERRRQEARTLLGMVLFHAGRTDESFSLRTETYDVGVRAGNLQAQVWGLLGITEHLLRLEEPAAATEHLRRAVALKDAVGRAERVWAAGLSAYLSALLEKREAATTAVENALRVMRGTVPTAFYALEGYSGVLSALALLEGTGPPALRWVGLGQLSVFAAAFPLGRPRLLYHLGCLVGPASRSAGKLLLGLSARSATRLGMTHETDRAENVGQRLER